MINKHYLEQPKHMVAFKVNQILARNPFLIKAKDRGFRLPPNRRYSHIPFNK